MPQVGRGPLFIWALCATPRRPGKIYYHFGRLCETLFPAVILWLIGRCLRRKGFVTIFNFPLAAFGPRRVLAGGFLFGPRPRGGSRVGPEAICGPPRRIAVPWRGSRGPSSNRPFP